MNDLLDLTIFSPPGCGISHKASVLILSLEFSLSLNFTGNRTMKRTIFPQSKKKKMRNFLGPTIEGVPTIKHSTRRVIKVKA